MFSQFFVLSLRGDTILHKDCKYSYANDWHMEPLDFGEANTFDACPVSLDSKQSVSLIICVMLVRKDLEIVKHTSYNST